jgi:predicted ATP-grasp superfamily ATP-dependent carboligase
MRVVLLEHFTSLPPGRATASLRAEGGAMLGAVARDLAACPGVSLRVLRRQARRPVAGRPGIEERALSGPPAAALRESLRDADAALVIAPETDGLLETLSRVVEESGRILLGPSAAAVRLAGDAVRTARLLAAAGVPAPWSAALRLAGATRRLGRAARGRTALRAPFVLKPADGCGGRGVVIVRRPRAIAAAVAAVRRATRRPVGLVQEMVQGEAASVSVIAGADRFLALGLNRQTIRAGRGAMIYAGGETPWTHPLADEAVETARAAVAALARAAPGVRGYLGVDLVLGPGGPRVLEINPRITTSYVGLARVVRGGIAPLILQAVLGGRLPDHVTVEGVCRFDARGVARGTRGGTGCSISAGMSAASI